MFLNKINNFEQDIYSISKPFHKKELAVSIIYKKYVNGLEWEEIFITYLHIYLG